MSDVSQSVLAKINKLLALADNKRGATEAESLLAASKAQELLQEYGLSIAEVEAAGGKSDDGGREKRVVKRGAMYAWQKALMATLADTNFCMHRIHVEFDEETKRRVKRHQLVGRRVNVEATQLTYDYLITTMKRRVRDEGYAPGTHSETAYHCWLEGCSERLRERLEEKAEQAKRDSAKRKAAGNGTGRELVLSDVYGSECDLNNDVLNGFAAGTTAAKRRANEEKARAFDAKYEELKATGVEDTEAWYLAHGYGAESAKQFATDWNRKQARASRRSSSGRSYRGGGWTKSDQRRAEKRDRVAYRAGSAAGDAIGLDPQAGHSEKKRIGK